jgi:hypothetical protein
MAGPLAGHFSLAVIPGPVLLLISSISTVDAVRSGRGAALKSRVTITTCERSMESSAEAELGLKVIAVKQMNKMSANARNCEYKNIAKKMPPVGLMFAAAIYCSYLTGFACHSIEMIMRVREL